MHSWGLLIPITVQNYVGVRICSTCGATELLKVAPVTGDVTYVRVDNSTTQDCTQPPLSGTDAGFIQTGPGQTN